jgi:hypothetical protein
MSLTGAFLLLRFGILSVDLVPGFRCVLITRRSALVSIEVESASLEVEESEPCSWEDDIWLAAWIWSFDNKRIAARMMSRRFLEAA